MRHAKKVKVKWLCKTDVNERGELLQAFKFGNRMDNKLITGKTGSRVNGNRALVQCGNRRVFTVYISLAAGVLCIDADNQSPRQEEEDEEEERFISNNNYIFTHII